MTDEVLTINEVAALLVLAENTVFSMPNKGEQPTLKVRGQWRFRDVDFGQRIEAKAKAVASTRPMERK